MHTPSLHIEPIPAFEDNYIWLLHNTRDAVVIDPGDAAPVLDTLQKKSLRLKAILITHHHSDHIDGVDALLKQYPATVYAPKYDTFDFKHTALAEGEHVDLPSLHLQFTVMWLPGHTLGHIAFVSDAYLLCGDVLFGAGCGRLFEGTPKQMLNSLNRLKSLNPQTKVYCTHEYTAKNIDFALTLDPKNQDLLERKRIVSKVRREHKASLPSTIALELKTNPFLRCNQDAIIQHSGSSQTDELSVFTQIRLKRNHY